ncbi:MAG: hypothetical protein HY536_01340, partial [Candidatus Colwellbacteria bacterium]|nr:hypothetical protein [Candidatus Colwellbacteria bacterium]
EVRAAPLEVLSHFGLHIGIEEYPRFENVLGKFMKKRITKDEFTALLDLPFDEGGIGFYRQKARRLADALEEVRELSDTAGGLEKEPHKASRAKARYIARWLLRGVKANLDDARLRGVEELVLERARNRYTVSEFRKQLALPANQGGAGLRSGTAKRIAEKIELIL